MRARWKNSHLVASQRLFLCRSEGYGRHVSPVISLPLRHVNMGSEDRPARRVRTGCVDRELTRLTLALHDAAIGKVIVTFFYGGKNIRPESGLKKMSDPVLQNDEL